MASSPDGARAGRTPHIVSHPAQPADEIPAIEQEVSAARRGQRVRKYLGERLPLQVEIGSRIAHSGVQARMAEPLADGGEVDAGLEQATAVLCRTECGWIRFSAQRRSGADACGDVLAKEIAHAEAGHLPAARVGEEERVCRDPVRRCAASCIRSRSNRAVAGQIGHSRTLLPLPCRRTWHGASTRTSRRRRFSTSWTRAPVLNIRAKSA